ncbi:DUF421 domain-containing protein [Dyadobacter sp. CY261]|uniref:DUF421 domain-containing protein n=1 Tax=Dyadobacter sp. CY261 TaxID=2907203 RepID=UPI001F1673C2|nr:YetF domain-containing protein [Dyadobacter sp. CY261]MCF0069486.1 DUF421 domain-containing protein [Dyadobacter sp. CY261]
MKKQDLIPGDWYRILFGETPVIFQVEVLLRTFIMYVALLIVVRLMGKRMGAQLTISELAVMITLGAIVSPGMQTPQSGLLLCTMILICALLFQRAIYFFEYKSKRFEQVTQGKMSILVKNGVMQMDELEKTKVSRQQLFAAIRNEHIFNLGDVDRVYLEACGLFSIFEAAEPRPGLILFPPDDESISDFQQIPLENSIACANCGHVPDDHDRAQQCSACGARQWGSASITRSNQPVDTAS